MDIVSVINVISWVGPIGPRPEDSANTAFAWMTVAAIVAFAAIVIAAVHTSIDGLAHVEGERRLADWQVWLVAMVLAAVSIGAAVAFGMPAAHESNVERKAWSAHVAEWAGSTYRVTAGADNLLPTLDCAAGATCYTGTVVVDGKMRPATLVIIGDTALLVDGDEGLATAHELQRTR